MLQFKKALLRIHNALYLQLLLKTTSNNVEERVYILNSFIKILGYHSIDIISE